MRHEVLRSRFPGAVFLGGESSQNHESASRLATPLSVEQTLTSPSKIIDFKHSPNLTRDMHEVLNTPWLSEVLAPLAAKSFWRVSHGVNCAEILLEAHREGKIEQSGLSLSSEEAELMSRAFVWHDLGTVFTNLSDKDLNPTVIWSLTPEQWENEMHRHPQLGVEIVAGNATPYERELVGNHHNYGERHYGYNPISEAVDSSNLPDERIKLLFSMIDVAEAMANVHRLYKEPSSLEDINVVLDSKFGDVIDVSLRQYIAQKAYDRREFELKGTQKIEVFGRKIRHNPDYQELWRQPGRLKSALVLAA